MQLLFLMFFLTFKPFIMAYFKITDDIKAQDWADACVKISEKKFYYHPKDVMMIMSQKDVDGITLKNVKIKEIEHTVIIGITGKTEEKYGALLKAEGRLIAFSCPEIRIPIGGIEVFYDDLPSN